MPNKPETLELSCLTAVCGGASQAELRTMARQYCPVTSAKYQNTPTLTRKMGEQCLDEAGLGAFKSRLDAYFPRSN